MKKDGILRIILMNLLMVLFSYFSIGYTYEIFRLGINGLRELRVPVNAIHPVNVDGQDFTPLFRLLGMVSNGYLSLIELTAYCLSLITSVVVILVITLILSVLFRVIAKRKITFVSAKEKKYTKISYIGMILLSLGVGLISTHYTVLLPLLLFTAVWALPFLLIYVKLILTYTDASETSSNL